MTRGLPLACVFAALGCAAPATPAPEGCLELFGLPEPIFDDGVEPGPGAEVWCGDTPEPALGPWDEPRPPEAGACEVVSAWHKDGREVELSRDTYAYDAAGHLVEAVTGEGVFRARFSPSGRPVFRTWTTPDPDSELQAWQTFTPDGQPGWLETRDGGYVSWEYGQDGALVAWKQGMAWELGVEQVRVELNSAGMPALVETQYDVDVFYERRTTFDGLAGVFRASGRGRGEFDDLTWRCDAAGRVVERHRSPPVDEGAEIGTAVLGFDEFWRYDAAGRLVWSWAGGAGAPQEERRAYDANGYLQVVEVRLDGEPGMNQRDVTVRDAAGRTVCHETDTYALVPVGENGEPGPTPCTHDREVVTYAADGQSATVRRTCLNVVEAETTTRTERRIDADGRVTERRSAAEGEFEYIDRYRYDCPAVPAVPPVP